LIPPLNPPAVANKDGRGGAGGRAPRVSKTEPLWSVLFASLSASENQNFVFRASASFGNQKGVLRRIHRMLIGQNCKKKLE